MRKVRGVTYSAVVLAASNILVKLIGVLFKVPLANLCGGTVLAYFNMAMSVFSFGMIAVTAGLPTATVRMIAASPEKLRPSIARAALRPALFFGAVSSAVIFFGAPKFAQLAGNPSCVYAIRVIAPGIFACCAVSILRSLSQGEGNMLPTAISQLVEAVLRLLVGLGAAYALLSQDTARVAAGAAAGVTAGEICALLCLSPMLLRLRNSERKRGLTRDLVKIAVPLTGGSLISTATNLLDTHIILRSLRGAGMSLAAATETYGIYSGYCMTLFSFPPTIIAALTASILPAVTACFSAKNTAGVRRLSRRALRVAVLIAMPCAAGFMAIPKQLLSLFFRRPEDIAVAAPLLAAIAPGAVFLALSSVCRSVLIACGKTEKTVLSTLFGCITRLVVTAAAVRIPSIGIFGAALGSVASMFVVAVSDMHQLRRLGLCDGYAGIILQPLALSLPILLLAPWICRLMSGIPSTLGTLFTVAILAVIYVILCVLCGIVPVKSHFTKKTGKIFESK